MKPLIVGLLVVLMAEDAKAQTQASKSAPESRVVESIVPWLAYNSACWSAVELRNLGNREVAAEVEAHKSSGALAPLVGSSGIEVRLEAGARAVYKLQLTEDTTGAWVRVRETVPNAKLSPVLAVSGSTECVAAAELRSTVREVAWPTSNPWFSGEVKRGDNGIMALINTSERPARVAGCYSSGILYSIPGKDRPTADMMPVCSETIEELIPPFGSRQFPISHEGNSHFSLISQGDSIVLQMLRPAGSSVKVYRVDSTITFGKEVPDK